MLSIPSGMLPDALKLSKQYTLNVPFNSFWDASYQDYAKRLRVFTYLSIPSGMLRLDNAPEGAVVVYKTFNSFWDASSLISCPSLTKLQ